MAAAAPGSRPPLLKPPCLSSGLSAPVFAPTPCSGRLSSAVFRPRRGLCSACLCVTRCLLHVTGAVRHVSPGSDLAAGSASASAGCLVSSMGNDLCLLVCCRPLTGPGPRALPCWVQGRPGSRQARVCSGRGLLHSDGGVRTCQVGPGHRSPVQRGLVDLGSWAWFLGRLPRPPDDPWRWGSPHTPVGPLLARGASAVSMPGPPLTPDSPALSGGT